MGENNSGGKAIIIIFFIIMFAPFLITFGLPLLAGFITLPPWAIVAIIAGIILVWIIATYNKFVSLNQRVKQAQGGIDVYLKQRFDLIPNLVETVKGYASYEKEIMENITNLRNDYMSRNNDDIQESQNLNNRYSRILAVVENYPELKADESFLKLQKTLSKIESQLQAARRIYNSEVTEFNTKRYKFPSIIIASICGFKEKPLFQIEEHEADNIDVKI